MWNNKKASFVARVPKPLYSCEKAKHPDYLKIFNEAQVSSDSCTVTGQTTLAYLADPKSTNIFKWLEWIVMDEHELGFCEKKGLWTIY